MNDFADPKMDEVLAAEHVLGVTDATERRKTTDRMETDPAFAMRVAHWQTRLQGLNGGFVPVDPPARIKRTLDRQLFDRRFGPRGWMWRGMSLTAASAAVGAFFLFPEIVDDPSATHLAQLSGSTHSVELELTGRQIAVTARRGAIPDGHALELWLVDKGQPVSVGLLGRRTIELPRRASDEMVLAVSLEPGGGAPEGTPTGPFVAEGALTPLSRR